MSPNFNDASLSEWLDANSEEMYDTLPFGVVRMSYDGTVTAYNNAESAIAGISRDKAKGKNFFTQVAPCTNNFMVAEKYKADSLDEVLPYIFTYITKPTPVEIRLLKAKNGNQYLLAKKAS